MVRSEQSPAIGIVLSGKICHCVRSHGATSNSTLILSQNELCQRPPCRLEPVLGRSERSERRRPCGHTVPKSALPRRTAVRDDDAVEQDWHADADKVLKVLGELRPGKARVGSLKGLWGNPDIWPRSWVELVVNLWKRRGIRESGDRGEYDAMRGRERLRGRYVERAV